MEIQRQLVKGERKHHRLTFNPNSVKMGEKLYVSVPALDPTLSIVPNTMHLIYNFKNSNDKSWPLNNMGRLFLQGLQVRIGKDIVYDNTGENVHRIYQDLWLSQQERDARVGLGITSLETRKHLAGTSGASSSSTSNSLLDSAMAVSLKNQRIPLGQILNDHGLHSPSANVETKYTLTLPSNSVSVGDKLSSQAVGDFSLENLELEYDTIQNSSLVNEQKDNMSQGKNFIINHTSLESINTWDKAATLVNENLHISRESLKAVVFLFKEFDQNMDEVYVYPNIDEVSCSVNGIPNVIHTNSMRPDMFEREARRWFQHENAVEMSTGKFFKSSFCIIIDFRSLGETKRYNDGVKVSGTSGIQTTFKKRATTKNIKCYTFVVSDSIVQVDASGFQKTIL